MSNTVYTLCTQSQGCSEVTMKRVNAAGNTAGSLCIWFWIKFWSVHAHKWFPIAKFSQPQLSVRWRHMGCCPQLKKLGPIGTLITHAPSFLTLECLQTNFSSWKASCIYFFKAYSFLGLLQPGFCFYHSTENVLAKIPTDFHANKFHRRHSYSIKQSLNHFWYHRMYFFPSVLITAFSEDKSESFLFPLSAPNLFVSGGVY